MIIDDRRSLFYFVISAVITAAFYYLPDLGGFMSKNFFLALAIPGTLFAIDFIISSMVISAQEKATEYKERFRK